MVAAFYVTAFSAFFATSLSSRRNNNGIKRGNDFTLFTSTTTPPSNNKYEVRFDRMVEDLRIPPAAVELIDSPKQRLLFKGVAAGVEDPLIRRAFAIVYRDLAPVRVAGDLIFSQLSAVAVDATERAGAIVVPVLEDDDLASASRRVFDILDGDRSGTLDRAELLASPEMLDMIKTTNDADESDEAAVDRFMATADDNDDGVISFVEFVNAAATQPSLRDVDQALALAMQSETSSSKSNKKSSGFLGRKPPDERFDIMLEQCFEWEQSLNCGPTFMLDDSSPDAETCFVDLELKNEEVNEEDNRLLQVLKGSLVGARCQPVVEALKMCYLEYSPLRLGGDIIFKLLKGVVANQVNKQNGAQ